MTIQWRNWWRTILRTSTTPESPEQHWRTTLRAFQDERTPTTLLALFDATEAYLPFFAPAPLYSAAHITTIALEFLHTLFTQALVDEPDSVLGACVRRSMTLPAGGYHDIDERLRVLGGYRFDLISRLDFADTLQDLLAPCPLHLQALVLYCVQFPHSRQQVLQAPQVGLVERWFLQHTLKYFAGGVMPMDRTVHFPMPQTETGRLFFFLSLYKSAPEIFVLLFLFRSFPHFVQFLQLFGGTRLEVPTLGRLAALCTTLTAGYTALEEGKERSAEERFVLTLLREAPALPEDVRLADDISGVFAHSGQR